MKTAVQEIREAIQLAIEVTIAVGRPVAQSRAMAALARLDDLEKQLAESEERGYERAESDIATWLDVGIKNASQRAWQSASRMIRDSRGHVGAAERVKGGVHG